MLMDISRLTHGVTRLITAENVYGQKGNGGKAMFCAPSTEDVVRLGQFDSVATDTHNAARDLGQKWKVRPCITLPKSSVTTIMDVDGPGCIQHLWITLDSPFMRDIILRFYWDGEDTPSVEVPYGDFFCCPFRASLKVTSIPINVNPTRGCNCYFPMPFRRHARITVENRNPERDLGGFFYAISFEERPIGDDEAYFHAQFRRQNPTTGTDDYVILDNVAGHGQYVGTAIGWQQNNSGWWGEGEVKAFIDGDGEFATYVGTGTEDYFGGAWGFCESFSAPFLGYQDITGDAEHREHNRVGDRHAMYRFHLPDPIRFEQDFRITIQLIGWRSEGRYLPLRDDICSVAYWYQSEPHRPFPPFGSRDELEVI